MLGYTEIWFIAQSFCRVEHFCECTRSIVQAVHGLRFFWKPPFSCVLQELAFSAVAFLFVEHSVEISTGYDRSTAFDEHGTHAPQDLPREEAHERNLCVRLPLASNPGQRHSDGQLNKTTIIAI